MAIIGEIYIFAEIETCVGTGQSVDRLGLIGQSHSICTSFRYRLCNVSICTHNSYFPAIHINLLFIGKAEEEEANSSSSKNP